MKQLPDWTCAHCGDTHPADDAGIHRMTDRGLISYCCHCENAICREIQNEIHREVEMENSLLVAFRLVAACICAIGAVLLALHGTDGWGWFLFVAFLLGEITVSAQ